MQIEVNKSYYPSSTTAAFLKNLKKWAKKDFDGILLSYNESIKPYACEVFKFIWLTTKSVGTLLLLEISFFFKPWCWFYIHRSTMQWGKNVKPSWACHNKAHRYTRRIVQLVWGKRDLVSFFMPALTKLVLFLGCFLAFSRLLKEI